MTGPGEGRPSARPDPTKMANQPALQTSSGLIWVVMGGLFAILSLVPFTMLTVSAGPSQPVALTAGALVVLLYALLLVLRFAIPPGPRRLRWLAACMLTMALVALLGVWLCALIENRG
ncbi:hypothetical protein [Leucobacter triazinivorans]|uniref:Uncharacterized protein n=1 Tax=Leucobacter triazinivorans TaxID=1784719 RepID=A0A4P6KEP6_9MICO|nr:hypothetical protein [Leucobacter triazinivorans]QBE48600.1 hypothetical protein EVS81_06955 [Leucobacter triazinivorans]